MIENRLALIVMHRNVYGILNKASKCKLDLEMDAKIFVETSSIEDNNITAQE